MVTKAFFAFECQIFYDMSLWHRLPLSLDVSPYPAPCSPQTSEILVFEIASSLKLS